MFSNDLGLLDEECIETSFAILSRIAKDENNPSNYLRLARSYEIINWSQVQRKIFNARSSGKSHLTPSSDNINKCLEVMRELSGEILTTGGFRGWKWTARSHKLPPNSELIFFNNFKKQEPTLGLPNLFKKCIALLSSENTWQDPS